jgi:hypothetical protein
MKVRDKVLSSHTEQTQGFSKWLPIPAEATRRNGAKISFLEY